MATAIRRAGLLPAPIHKSKATAPAFALIGGKGKEHAADTGLPKCYIIDDTPLENSGIATEHISRVYDHVKGRCVLGYKLLLCAFLDGKTTLPIDFSLHAEKGKPGDYGLTDKQKKARLRMGSVGLPI